MNDFGLHKYVLGEIVGVIKAHKVSKAKIFGSRAKGNFQRYSDIDIAIFADCDQDLSGKIASELEDLDIIYKVDVVHYEKLSNAEIKEHIDRVGVDIL